MLNHLFSPVFLAPAFLGNVGPVELGVVFVIVLIVFGPGKLPDVFKAFGSGVKQFKDAAAGVTETTKLEDVDKPVVKVTEVVEEKKLTEV